MTTTQPEGDFPCCTLAAVSGPAPAPAAESPLRCLSPRELFDLAEPGAEGGDFPHFTAALNAYVAQGSAVAATEAWSAAFGEAAHILALHHHPASATLLTAHAARIGENSAAPGPTAPRQPVAGPAGTAPATLMVGVEDCTMRTYMVTAPVPVELLTPEGQEQLLVDWLNSNEPLWLRQCTAPAVAVRSDPGTMGLVVVDVAVQDHPAGNAEVPAVSDEVLTLVTVDGSHLGPYLVLAPPGWKEYTELRFTRAAAGRFAADLNSEDEDWEGWSAAWRGDALSVTWPENWDTVGGTRVTVPDQDGLYVLGRVWPWAAWGVDDKPEPSGTGTDAYIRAVREFAQEDVPEPLPANYGELYHAACEEIALLRRAHRTI